MPYRDLLKRTAAAGAGLLPQARFGRCLLLIGHMRCGSTALANVICGHPSVSGYGEAQVGWTRSTAPGALLVNQLRRRRWSPRAEYLFDKILHDRLDHDPHPGFFRARAIFLVRDADSAVASILDLFRRLGSRQYASPEAAAAYYADRVARMRALWTGFPPDRRLALTYEEMVATPAMSLSRLSDFAGLRPGLVNRYPSGLRPLAPGAGDPLADPRLPGIVLRAPRSVRLPDSREIARARRAHADFLACVTGEAA